MVGATGPVAAASGGITEAEAKSFDRFFGAGTATRLNAAAMKDDLDRRVRQVKEAVPRLRRAQVLRDVCVIALADGHVQPEERAVLDALAAGLDVDPGLVDATLATRPRLD